MNQPLPLQPPAARPKPPAVARHWIRSARARGEIYRDVYSRNAFRRDARFVAAILARHGYDALGEVLGSVPREWILTWPADRRRILSEIDLDEERTLAWAARYLARLALPKFRWTGPGVLESAPFVVRRGIYTAGTGHRADDANPLPPALPLVGEGREAWYFVNGILTDEVLGSVNAQRLSDLFHRKVTLLGNPTTGPIADLVECMDDRTLDAASRPAVLVALELRRALAEQGRERVVLFGHSQGTLIAAAAVELLFDLGVPIEALGRLEVYLMASCVDHVRVATPGGRMVPHVEHFQNERDLVARLGPGRVAPPTPPKADAAGPRYFRREKRGHLLNLHYLDAFEPGYAGEGYEPQGGAGPSRLLRYLGGGHPA